MLRDTVFLLTMLKTLGLPFELRIYVILSEMQVLLVWVARLHFQLSVVFEITVSEIAMVDSPRFAVGKKQI